MAKNVNPLPLSPPAQFISSANVFVPQLIHPPPRQSWCQPQKVVRITHAGPHPPDPNVWRFRAAVSTYELPIVGTFVNLNSVQPAPLSNPRVSTSLRSSFHVQAPTRSQNHVVSDFMQTNPVSSSTGTAPPLIIRSFCQLMELPFPIRCVGVVCRIPHFRLLLWTPGI